MRPGVTLAAAQTAIRNQIHPFTGTPDLDARVLLAHVCQVEKSWLLAHPEATLSREQANQLERSLKLLTSGTPLPYVLGEWEFYGRRFKVTHDVLIPRPETELLVETALNWLRTNPDKRTAVEVGAGSGVVSTSLAAAIPDLVITATEISPQAAAVARENVSRHGLENQISVREEDLLTSLPGPFDLIAANLPYIPTQTLHTLPVYQREPTLALDGGEDGFDQIRRLMKQAKSRLSGGGLILLEIGSDQGESAREMAEDHFSQADYRILSDLAGHPRLLVVQT